MPGMRKFERRPTRVWGAGGVPTSAGPDRRSCARPGPATTASVATGPCPSAPVPIAVAACRRRRLRRKAPREQPQHPVDARARGTRWPSRGSGLPVSGPAHHPCPHRFPGPLSPLPQPAAATSGEARPAALHCPPVSPPRGRVGQQRHASSRRRPRETRDLTARPFPAAALRRPARTARAARPACLRAGTPRPSDRTSGPPIRTGAPEPAPWKTSATRSNTSRP